MKRIVVVFLLLLSTGCTSQANINTIEIENHIIEIEVAQTQEKKNQGLMFRESLQENQGMLFIWEDEKERSFWMKNTLIPLDMIFLNRDGIIVNIEEANPCKEDRCPNYLSKYPSKYVLEVNKGWSKENNIKIGTQTFINIVQK